MTAPALPVRPRTTPLNLDPGRLPLSAGDPCIPCWHRTGHVVGAGGRLWGGAYVCNHTTGGITVSAPTIVRWCTTCDLPEHRWDAQDPLYRPGAGQCPGCIRADIDDDQRCVRREDAL